jgi:hypothetical protein
MANEEEIVAINSELSDFLIKWNPTIPTFVWVNAGSRTRGTQPVAARFWLQEERRMISTSTVCPGSSISRESAALWGIQQALGWRHALEPALEFYPDT